MRITDIFMTLPYIMMALIFSSVSTPILGRSLLPPLIAMIAFGWMGYAWSSVPTSSPSRSATTSWLPGASGLKSGRILFKHILPNAIFLTLVLASLGIGDVVLGFAALSFLGIGTEVGYADWGQVLSFARNWITSLISTGISWSSPASR